MECMYACMEFGSLKQAFIIIFDSSTSNRNHILCTRFIKKIYLKKSSLNTLRWFRWIFLAFLHHQPRCACIIWCVYAGIIMCEPGIWRLSVGLDPLPLKQGLPSRTSTGTATLLGEGAELLFCWSCMPFSCIARFVLYLKITEKEWEMLNDYILLGMC